MGKKNKVNKVNIIDTDNILNLTDYNIKDLDKTSIPDLNNITNVDNKSVHNESVPNELDIKNNYDILSVVEDNILVGKSDDHKTSSNNLENDLIKTNNNIKVKNKDILDKPSTDIIKELLKNQLKNVNISKRLNYNDIKRISKFLTSSIFDPTKCSLWTGYITNEQNQSKGTYINFYFNKKKIALHRLLYLNFIGDIINTEYLKFSCLNKGKCCNIHHLKKYSYNSLLPNNLTNKLNPVDNTVHINRDKESLSVEL